MVNPTTLVEKGLDSQMAGIFIAALAVSLTAGLAVTGNAPMVESSQEEGTTWDGVYTVKVIDGDTGEVKYHEKKHNTLTTQGRNWIRSQIATPDDVGTNDDDEAQYISVGNGSDVTQPNDVLDSEIQCCGLERTSGSTTNYGDGEFEVQNTFTANLGDNAQVIVNTTGLNWASTNGGNQLISGGSFPNANLLDGDQLTVTHNVTISDGGN